MGFTLAKSPELLITQDYVLGALSVMEMVFPKTVEEALAASGGVQKIQGRLMEVLKATGHVPDLQTFLDSYPDNIDNAKGGSSIIRGRHNKPAKLDTSGTDLSAESLINPPVRIYLGKSLVERLTNHGKLAPATLEAIAELRSNLYAKMGVAIPGIRFSPGKFLPDNGFQIEFKTLPLSRVHAIQGAEEVHEVMQAVRQCFEVTAPIWLSAETVDDMLQKLPINTEKWLRAHYSITDLKQILRQLIAAPKEIINQNSTTQMCPGDFSTEPIPDHSWLLSSLVFWTATPHDMQSIDTLARELREMIKVREHSKRNAPLMRPERVEATMHKGVDNLVRGKAEEAKRLFDIAIRVDKEGARRAFLHLYGQSEDVSTAGQLARLEKDCSVPVRSMSEHDMFNAWLYGIETPTRYEIDRYKAIREPGVVSPTLELCQLRSYVRDGALKLAHGKLSELLIADKRQWEAGDQYNLAYLLLDIHVNQKLKTEVSSGHLRQRREQPPYIYEMRELLLSATMKSSDEIVQDMLQNIGSLYKSPPRWLLLMIESAMAAKNTESFHLNAAIMLAADHSKTALQRATERLESVGEFFSRSDRVPKNLRSWKSFTDGQVAKSLGATRSDEILLKALGHFEAALEDNFSKPGWPKRVEIYDAQADTYLLLGETEHAFANLAQGYNAASDSTEKMEFLRLLFRLYLAKGDFQSAQKTVEDRLRQEPDNLEALFNGAIVHFISKDNSPILERTVRKFIRLADHPYADLIALLEYWRVHRQGADEAAKREAENLLTERWSTIDRMTWEPRIEQGDGDNVVREKLLGYYSRQVSREELLDVVQDETTFDNSPYGRSGLFWEDLACEVFFYDALFQEVKGFSDSARIQLQKVIGTRNAVFVEFSLARYLLGQ
jgi:tetratricopeptide (TPR) repeat protein